MMPTLWVSCTALVLVAVFVPLLAVAVALPFVDDVRFGLTGIRLCCGQSPIA